ncbi:MAG: hypothetical protein FJ098_02695, partial [Deltaproteobacteria bacterium]|nr:hypothetical protein [Deltaproteobacteria bacterium]
MKPRSRLISTGSLALCSLLFSTCSPPSPGVSTDAPADIAVDAGGDAGDVSLDLQEILADLLEVLDVTDTKDVRPDADACVPLCEAEGRECGDDGCGGSCGDCGEGFVCVDFLCLESGAPGTPCGGDGDCDDGPCIGPDGGRFCSATCDGEGDCPEGWLCVPQPDEAGTICVPACPDAPTCDELEALCGFPEDGCGTYLWCGDCGEFELCNKDFVCVCAFLSCGGACCAQGETCKAGACTSPCDPPCGPCEDCVGTACQPKTCTPSCGPGFHCDCGACLPGGKPGDPCSVSSPCMDGLECVGGVCCGTTDATCDGIDDDCDGFTDEDYVPDASCGQGPCLEGNTPSSCAGGVETPCKPGLPLSAADTSCDGVDDDCDGAADDDYAAEASCGTGACKTGNTPSSCLEGTETPCVPGLPLAAADATCDGVDDDCDGLTDEDYVPVTACGTGWCLLSATPSSCTGGVETLCKPGVPQPADLSCNGVDDDCDAAVDDDYLPKTNCGTGVCQLANTPSSCVDGFETPCQPGAPAAAADLTCDGLDDDCDGVTDEDYVPVTACSFGVCKATATPSACASGVETPCQPGNPTAAVDDDCDLVDDDCDGASDEDADPVCTFGTAVSGLRPVFHTTLGRASGVVADHGDGTYSSELVDLSNPAATAAAGVTVNGNPSEDEAFSVVAGAPADLSVAASRTTVHADDATLRACAQVRDALGAPVAAATPVTLTLSLGGQTIQKAASHQADGVFCAELTTTAGVFQLGATGSLAAGVSGLAADPVAVTAAALPPALDLAVGRAGLRLPLGPRHRGTTFAVPVLVNTGSNTLGSYNLALEFDEAVLEVTGLTQGAATDLAPPVSNAGTTANATGSLSFNAINVNPGGGTAKGPAVEVAVIHFKVRASAQAGAQAVLTGTALELYNTALVSFLTQPAMVLWDGDGAGTFGMVKAVAVTVSGLFAHPLDNALLDLRPLTGEPAVTRLAVWALRSDGSLADVWSQPGTLCQVLDADVASSAGCVVTAEAAGSALVLASAGGLTADARLRVLGPSLPLEITVTDPLLQYIGDLDVLQEARAVAHGEFTDGDLFSHTLDVTDLVAFESLDSGVVTVAGAWILQGQGNGATAVVARGADGIFLGQAAIAVAGNQSVSVQEVRVLVPARVTLLGLQPSPVPDDQGQTTASASATNLFTADGQQVQSTVLLVLSDDVATGGGSRMDVTDWNDPDGLGAVSFQSLDEAVATVDAQGLVTAVGTGEAQIRAQLVNDGTGFTAQGSGVVQVQLPPPVGVTVSVPDGRLALSASDTAATTLGLPVSRQLSVVVHFADGTSKDFTAAPPTVYSVNVPVVEVKGLQACGGAAGCVPGRVTSLGVAPGAATVSVTFPGTYLAVVSGSVQVKVVTHAGLALETLETHTPAGESPVKESVLSFMEGTAARQEARLRVTETFTDGTALDVSAAAGTTFTVYAVGTQVPDASVATVSPARRLLAVGPGVVDVVAWNASHASLPATVTVNTAREDLLLQAVTYAGGSTFLGVKNTGTGALQVAGTFGDGTRRLLTGADLVSGLLAFSSSNVSRVTVDATGGMVIRGNGAVTILVDVTPTVDTGLPFHPPAARALAANLTPATGDVDLGAATGLPFPDREGDEVFTLPVRVNTGSKKLGGVDLQITYNAAVLEALDASVGAALPGAIFNANIATPGVVLLNASPSLSNPVGGAAVEVAVLTFRAIKAPGGPAISAMGGVVKGVVATDGETLGAAVPRALVAGAGDLDPFPGGVWGDANDDEQFSIADVLFVQKILVVPPLVIPTPTQLVQSDLFPDGVVASNDAFYASQNLAELTHFVEAWADPHPVLAGHFDLTVRVTDRDQDPADQQVRVRLEVSVVDNLETILFTNDHDVTPQGVLTTAVPAGGGLYRTHVSGLVSNETLGVVVILDVLSPQGVVVASTSYLGTP